MAMVEVRSVTKCYGSLTAVQDVSFSVDTGEIVGFVGPNGAGKSTVLKMLSTYLYPTAGRIIVDGLDAEEQALAVRRRIGYLAGDTPLYQTMRVDGFLRFVGQARGLRGKDLAKGFDWVVGVCGLGPVLLQRISQCSTGFRQRVGLASALIHNPPILLLDEPTHGFDPLQVLAFRDLLRDLSPNRAILFSSHIIQEVATLSSRILIIHSGHLLADGRQRDLAEATGEPEASLEEIFSVLVQRYQEKESSHA